MSHFFESVSWRSKIQHSNFDDTKIFFIERFLDGQSGPRNFEFNQKKIYTKNFKIFTKSAVKSTFLTRF